MIDIHSENIPESIVECSTLIDLLRWRAATQPERVAYTFLLDGESQEVRLTYGDLDRQARAIAALLQRHDAYGERVLLLYPAGLDYIAAFFGCLYAGAIAVPAYPPDPARLTRTLPRLQAIASDAQARFALATANLLARLEQVLDLAPDLKSLRWLATDVLPVGMQSEWRGPQMRGDSVAFLQYTSGSTSEPRGVLVSHSNLLHNERMIQTAFGHTEESTFVGWLPLYHDMGLIGNVLQPLYIGAACVLMSPASFLQNPVRWLKAIARYKGHTSGGPNFAYDLCCRKVEPADRAGLDLSSWKVAFNGAEPVRGETLDQFTKIFEPYGFRREAFSPCYGLAEATLIVSGHNKNDLSPAHLQSSQVESLYSDLIGCGRSLLNQKIAIVNPASLSECLPGEVGEIWVSGPSVAQGYWNRLAETVETFHARISETGEGPFLRTGDLGFVKHGQLFVTGRIKDLIIIRGRNHYPQDIEHTMEQSHTSLRRGCGAAFSVEVGGEERLVVVQELSSAQPEPDIDGISMAIRRAISELHDVHAYEVVFIKPGTIPKTSSGKIQRHECRAGFLTATLDIIGTNRIENAEPSPAQMELQEAGILPLEPHERRKYIESIVKQQVANVIGIAQAQIHELQPLVAFGLDSLMSVDLQNRIESRFDTTISADEFLKETTIHNLASLILDGLGEKPRTANKPRAIKRATGQAEELSYGQQRLWFLEQLDPTSRAYNICGAIHLQGPLNHAALLQSLNEIARRHEALRTSFEAVDGKPRQVISQQSRLEMPVIDLTDQPEEVARCHSEALLRQESRRGFDLTTGPLMRVKVIKQGPQQQVLVVTMHHIVTDGWSMSVMVEEMRRLYETYSRGEKSGLEELKIQYADYAQWQRQQQQSEIISRQMEYWKGVLGGELPVLEMGGKSRSRRAGRHPAARERLEIGKELSRKIEGMSRSEGVTKFMVMEAAFKVLLQRYSGQEDLIVGTPIANRRRAEVEGLIGFFVNTVALRSRVEAGDKFEEVLRREREVCLGAYGNQDAPFERVVEEVGAGREAGRGPIYDVMFAMEKTGNRNMQLEGMSAKVEEVSNGSAKYEMTMSIEEEEGKVEAVVEYDEEVYEGESVRRMMRHYRRILEEVVEDREKEVGSIEMLSEEERREIVEEWNETEEEYEREASIDEEFEKQARRRPDAIGVVSGGEQLSYGEISRRSNQIARYLMKRGAGLEEKVGICVERGAEMVEWMMGITKAGGAYVPLDPKYPEERIGYMMKDSGVRMVVTGRGQEEMVRRCWEQKREEEGRGDGEGVIEIEAARKEIEEERDEEVESGERGKNLAYVIYTSGSTGKPKGVEVEHRSVINLLRTMERSPGFSSDDILLAVTTLSFDMAGLEIFLPLIAGGKVVIASREEVRDATLLKKKLSQCQATVMQATTAGWRVLLGAEWEGNKNLKMLVGGEALTEEQAKVMKKKGGRVWNVYGPTETTVWSTKEEIEEESEEVTIGKPIGNTRVYIVDKGREIVAKGVEGELEIGGEGVARGYRGKVEETAERYVPDRWSEEGGKRVYRTGDRCRYKEGGKIEYLGRKDHQMKVRGYRVEVGEIEEAMKEQKGVTEAVVVMKGARAGGEELVAYVVAQPEISRQQIREELRRKVPDYMVVSRIVKVERLPLTVNGKVDRRALREREDEQEQREGGKAKAETAVEEVLSGIWAEVLGMEEVGVDESFFDLGGHSLLATQVISRVRSLFKVDIPLRKMFEAQTVTEFAGRIEEVMKCGYQELIAPITAVERTQAEELSYGQQRLWFLEQLDPTSRAYNICGAIYLQGPLNHAALLQSLNEIVRRHEALRTSFEAVDGKPRQVISQPCSLEMPVIDLADQPEDVARCHSEALLRQESRRGFDLTTGPLMRVKVIKQGHQQQVLVVTMHHIVTDGWSMSVMVEEMRRLYEAYSRGEESGLEELKIQYADYAQWQRQQQQSEIISRQMEYWKGVLGGELPVLEMGGKSRSRRAGRHPAARERLEIGEELSRKIERMSRSEGVTKFMVMEAAFKVLLQRYSGQEDLIVGTPIANRRRAEVEGLIGFFVNTVALRSRVEAGDKFEEVLRREREVCLGAYGNQDAPFERVVEEVGAGREAGRGPIYDVMFAMEKSGNRNMQLEGMNAKVEEVSNGSAKYEMTMSIEEEEGKVEAVVEYDEEVYEGESVRRMMRHYRRILEEVVEDREKEVGSISMMSEEERREIVEEWNETEQEYEREASIDEEFEKQARRRPDAIGVVSGSEQLSYGEISRRSNQIARYLMKRGAGLEEKVGICVKRGAEMVEWMMGIMKAGGAYVPLDPKYPEERIGYMMKDSGVRMVVTGRGQEEMVRRCWEQKREEEGRGEGEGVIEIEVARKEIEEEREEEVKSGERGKNLAYVIYTSGSTGKPKGVEIEHSALMNLITWHLQKYGVNSNDRATQIAEISFDASVWEIWTCLAAGASLHIIPDETRLSGIMLVEWLAAEDITITFLPTLLAEYLLDEPWPDNTALRIMFTGGDKLTRRPEPHHRFRFENVYGPTETAVIVTAEEVSAAGQDSEPLSIGGPISNAQIYLLDRGGQPVAVRMAGEIYVGGENIARGYSNRPDLTAERFLPDWLGGGAGKRLYRTGDLARHKYSGKIEFIDRIDLQIKMRGRRIEVGEIEEAVKEQKGVTEAVVVMKGARAGGEELVAYVVAQPEISRQQIREELRRKVPDYMVVSRIVKVERLPLTVNGKVDRRALREREDEQEQREGGKAKAETAVEEVLSGIWAEVLGMEEVGVDESFFDLGGHSLLATQVISRIRELLQVNMPLGVLFRASDVSSLAKAILADEVERPRIEKTAELVLRVFDMSDEQIDRNLLESDLHREESQVR